jgi:hypothetical protein
LRAILSFVFFCAAPPHQSYHDGCATRWRQGEGETRHGQGILRKTKKILLKIDVPSINIFKNTAKNKNFPLLQKNAQKIIEAQKTYFKKLLFRGS